MKITAYSDINEITNLEKRESYALVAMHAMLSNPLTVKKWDDFYNGDCSEVCEMIANEAVEYSNELYCALADSEQSRERQLRGSS